MRARGGLLVGWGAVGLYAALLVVVAVGAVQREDLDRSQAAIDPVGAFIEAWERSRTGTFVATGTFERRSEVTGAVISSQDVVAQRPPARLHRQLGGIDGRVDDRLLVCPAPPPGGSQAPPCQLGAPRGSTYDEAVAAEVEGLRDILGAPEALYGVERDDDGCFALVQRRVDPRAPFGIAARFCFDPTTGAPTARQVDFEGGITESLVVTEVRAEVTDGDLRP
jgi:hypothetical protein